MLLETVQCRAHLSPLTVVCPRHHSRTRALPSAVSVRVGRLMSAPRQRAASRGAAGKEDATAAEDSEPPHHLRCPITLTLFRDPVVTSAGHSYERSALLAAWQASGRTRDPSTGETISASLTPNWNLRQQVQAWLDARPDVIPEGWPDRRVPRLKSDGTPRDDPNEGVAAAQPHAWAMLAPREWVIWVALAACAFACGFTPRSVRAAFGWGLLSVGTRLVAPAVWETVQEMRDELEEHWLLIRYQFKGIMANAAVFAMMYVLAEGAVLLASQLLLPPAVLSGEGLVSATMRWATRASWYRPVFWLQFGLSAFTDNYAPDTSGYTFAAQLLAIAPAMSACGFLWRTLLACVAYFLPQLSAVLAWMQCPLAFLLGICAVSPDEEDRIAAQVRTRTAIARILHGPLVNALSKSRYVVGALMLMASLLLVPFAAQAAAGACMPMPLRMLRFLFGAETVAAGCSTALHAATSAGCGATMLRVMTPLPLSALDAADGRGATPAVLAAQRGDAAALHALAEAGASLTALAASFGTPLHAAAAGDHVAAAEALLQLSPDAVSLRDASGATPLVSAVCAGAEATAMLLLAYGADASPAALALHGEAHTAQSLLMLALPQPVLLDELVRARCAAIAAAASPAAAAALLRAELVRAQGELKISAPQLPPEAARVLARLQEGAVRCDGREDA